MRRWKDEDEAPASTPGWFVTFSDMMSLLLGFFILLYSVSEVREDGKFQSMINGLKRHFGEKSANRDAKLDAAFAKTGQGRNQLLDAVQRGAANGKNDSGSTAVEFSRVANKIVPRQLAASLSFAGNQAELAPDQRRSLRVMAERWGSDANRVEIRAAVSEQCLRAPSLPQSRQEWEQAYGRCLETMNYLVKLGVQPDKVQISVGGKDPVADGQGKAPGSTRDPSDDDGNAAIRVWVSGLPMAELPDVAPKIR